MPGFQYVIWITAWIELHGAFFKLHGSIHEPLLPTMNVINSWLIQQFIGKEYKCLFISTTFPSTDTCYFKTGNMLHGIDVCVFATYSTNI